jgi:hypothetical protein
VTTIGEVTRRAWLILAVGAVLAASLGGVALANRGSSATFAPTASWNMFPPAQWDALKARAAAKGLDPATLHVVGATSRHGGEPLALVAGTKGARTCFMPVVGDALGAPICRLAKPLTLFAFADTFVQTGSRGRPARKLPAVEILGLARADIASVVGRSTVDGRPWSAGEPLLAVPHGFVFAGGQSGAATTYIARNRAGRVVARIRVAPRGH